MLLDDGNRRKLKACIVLFIILLLLLAVWVLLQEYEVRTVYVEGNRHYSAAEIREIVEAGWFGDNTLVLSLRYRNKSITDVPFVETMDVRVVDRNTIRVMVYEKALAGYVQYLDRYMYFDKDGIIVESSTLPTAGIPQVTGLRFDHFVMYEPLEVADESVFLSILNITQMLEKYEIAVDRIYFDESNEMTLYLGAVRVRMGSNDLIEEKVQQLDAILREGRLSGESGVLDMGRYETGRESITFSED